MTKMGIRTAVMGGLEVPRWVSILRRHPVRKITDIGYLLRYAMQGGWGRTKRKKMNIDEMIPQWIEAVVGMCTAHDKDEYDAHDAKTDSLLGPLLTAPVKQIREFYKRLLQTMKDDKRVPLIVWMGFDAWGKVMVEDAPDEGIKRLKNKLAADIADLVEEDIRDQIPQAIQRALRWRDPETLEKVKETLESGVKPKLRGRESCLFLEAGRGKNKVCVML